MRVLSYKFPGRSVAVYFLTNKINFQKGDITTVIPLSYRTMVQGQTQRKIIFGLRKLGKDVELQLQLLIISPVQSPIWKLYPSSYTGNKSESSWDNKYRDCKWLAGPQLMCHCIINQNLQIRIISNLPILHPEGIHFWNENTLYLHDRGKRRRKEDSIDNFFLSEEECQGITQLRIPSN